jgi:adenine-specific DNA-methyltransferase
MAGQARKSSVDALTHKDKRANIPTDELSGFVTDEDKRSMPVSFPRWRTGRDGTSDPQLVWSGKDEEDQDDLEVLSVPIYIHEKINPQALVEDLRRGDREADDLRLFDDFDGIEFEDLVDFYRHEQNWSNRLVLGDALLVMTSLAQRENLKGTVQMIYMDPPYGVSFRSNWQVSSDTRDVKDGRLDDLTRQPEQIQAFRDTWKFGIHSYLSYLRDRIAVARDLLTESGSIFVQIGDENVHLVRALLDEVFGADSFVSQIAFTKAPGGLESTSRIGARLDYILWYSKNPGEARYQPLFQERRETEAIADGFTWIETSDGNRRRLTREERLGTEPLPEDGRLFMDVSLTKPGPGSKYSIEFEGREYSSGRRWWGMTKESLERLIANGRVIPVGNGLRFVRYFDDFPFRRISNVWAGLGGASDPVYVVQTNEEVVKRCMLMVTEPGDLVLDPTCGSGTTAVVAERWGRRWITIDTSRVAVSLARMRIMGARHPYYLLIDSDEGRDKIAELHGQMPADSASPEQDVRKGFVVREQPRISPSTIGSNPALDDAKDDSEARAAIARHATRERIVDQPYENNRLVRVAGPFTVESLSPHRHLAGQPSEADTDLNFVDLIVDNLTTSGVQNRVRSQRIEFRAVDLFPGTWVQAHGRYVDEGDTERLAAISIGPEYGTVGPDHVREAAKEAVRGEGADVLLVCGFAFDALSGEAAKEFAPVDGGEWAVAEQEKQLGKLPVLLVKMNADLSMGRDLLKKSGAANLFTVFGEPDLEIETDGDDTVVKLRGVDVYDPTTGEVRSDSTDGIACWFIDTDYNGESFFVRHAYFTGANDPYERLKASLAAEIDEDQWESLYTTVSRPFPRPDGNKIAVKVINHFGDEVVKVYDLRDRISRSG